MCASRKSKLYLHFRGKQELFKDEVYYFQKIRQIIFNFCPTFLVNFLKILLARLLSGINQNSPRIKKRKMLNNRQKYVFTIFFENSTLSLILKKLLHTYINAMMLFWSL